MDIYHRLSSACLGSNGYWEVPTQESTQSFLLLKLGPMREVCFFDCQVVLADSTVFARHSSRRVNGQWIKQSVTY